MRCPYCGNEVKQNIAYCPECGGKLKTEDNSKDDTLRLPDLSGVPLGGVPRARRTPAKKKSGRLTAWLILIMAATVATAVCLAFAFSGGIEKRPADEGYTDLQRYDENYENRDGKHSVRSAGSDTEPLDGEAGAETKGRNDGNGDDASHGRDDEGSAEDDDDENDAAIIAEDVFPDEGEQPLDGADSEADENNDEDNNGGGGETLADDGEAGDAADGSETPSESYSVSVPY